MIRFQPNYFWWHLCPLLAHFSPLLWWLWASYHPWRTEVLVWSNVVSFTCSTFTLFPLCLENSFLIHSHSFKVKIFLILQCGSLCSTLSFPILFRLKHHNWLCLPFVLHINCYFVCLSCCLINAYDWIHILVLTSIQWKYSTGLISRLSSLMTLPYEIKFRIDLTMIMYIYTYKCIRM